jgi:hypothetical protein
MAFTVVNLSMSVGEDQPFTDTITKADGVTPQDVTGWTFTFVVHAYGDPNVVYITKTPTAPVPSNGQVNYTVANADTINMLPNCYQWYIARTDGANNKQLSGGLFSLSGK